MIAKQAKCLMIYVMAALSTMAGASEYPFDEQYWNVSARETSFVTYRGEQALKIKGGYATVIDVEQTDGLIEFDIAVSEQRGFAGAIFRVQDLQNYEHFYVRGHQSGKPDATQYTPVFNGVSGWQLYHGPGFGVPVSFPADEWMHVRIAFAGDRADIYIDSDTPQLTVAKLKRPLAGGGVGVGAGNFAPAHFANFEVKPLPAGYRFAADPPLEQAAAAGTVMSWQVSRPFPVAEATEQASANHRWQVLPAEPTGITNLAQITGVNRDNRAVIARLRLHAPEKQHCLLSLGYSDDVTVYVNGEPVYSGSNRYQTRDYRYLGTIGLFDRPYLPLKSGENEVRFVVTEAFGGWGILARLEDGSACTIIKP